MIRNLIDHCQLHCTRTRLVHSDAKIDDKIIKKFNVRSALQVLLSGHDYEAQSIKQHQLANVEVIPAANQTSCVLVTFGNVTYYINPGVGFHEAQLNLGKVRVMNSVLFTRFDWKSALSLIPTLLNHQQLKSETIDFFGPFGMREVFATLMPLVSSVKAWERWQTKLVFHETHHQSSDVIVKKEPADVKIIGYPSQLASHNVFGYIFYENKNKSSTQNSSYQGTFLTWKDFPTVSGYGTYLRQCLDSCDKCTIDNSGTPCPPTSVCVLDCSDQKLLYKISQDQDFFTSISEVSLCIHLAPRPLYYSEDYFSFLRKLSTCRHVSVHDLCKLYKVSDKSQCYRAFLHTLQPSFFPLYDSKKYLESLQKQLAGELQGRQQAVVLLNNDKIHFKVNKLTRKREVENIVEHFQKEVAAQNVSQFSSSSLFPHLVVFGSGSSNISLLRAPPCYFLRICPNSSILIDCGPSSFAQVFSHYGTSLAKQVFATLRAVVLTHKHSDHWCGFIDFLANLHEQKSSRSLLVFLPKPMKKFFEQNYDSKLLKKLKFMTFEEYEYASSLTDYDRAIARQLNLRSLQFVRVSHGPPTYGVVIELLDKKKVVYSSDTLPLCKDLILAGSHAHLLIHDCLYTNEADREMASFRMHSTLGGAAATAKQMKAKNLLLTHFAGSLRFLPADVNELNLDYDGKILISFDHLELPLKKVNDYAVFLDNLSKVLKKDAGDEKCNGVYKTHRTEQLVELYEQVKSIDCG